jgi:hypothetical protein
MFTSAAAAAADEEYIVYPQAHVSTANNEKTKTNCCVLFA